MTWWTDVEAWPAELAVWMYVDCCCGADQAEHCQWPCETWLVLGCHRPHESEGTKIPELTPSPPLGIETSPPIALASRERPGNGNPAPTPDHHPDGGPS